MSWENKNGKHSGLVCATHDRELGRTNLSKYIPVQEVILFERYLRLTVELDSYPDFPEWMKQEGKVYTPLTPTTHIQSTAPTELLGLSPRVRNALRRNEIITIEKLANTSPHELLKIHALGQKGLREIQQKLKEFK